MTALNWKKGSLLAVLSLVCACSRTSATDGSAAGAASAAAPVVGATGDSLRHLPPGCQVAGRLEVDEVMGSPQLAPHREEVEVALGQRVKDGKVPLLSRLFQQLGLDAQKGLGRAAFCLREAAAGSAGAPAAAGKAPFVVALSGTFEPDSVLDAMVNAAPAGRFRELKVAGVRVLERQGRFFAQSSDRVLLVSSDEQLLGSALGVSDAYKAYALPEEGVGALVASEEALRTLSPAAESRVAHPVEAEVGKAKRLELQLALDPGQLLARLALPSAEEAALSASRLERILAPFTEDGPQLVKLREHLSAELLASLKGIKFQSKAASVTVTIPLSAAAIGEVLHGFALLSGAAQQRPALAAAGGRD